MNAHRMTENKPKKIAAIIPAYNEAGRIGNTIKQVSLYVDEVLVVDDASSDGTAQEAEQAGVRVVRQIQNKGYVAALKRGLQETSGDIAVTIDADGEFPANKIPDLVQPILDGQADMVQGQRDHVSRPSERLLNWLANMKAPVGDSGTGFRALEIGLARILDIRGACICGVFSLEVVAKNGRILEIPVHLETVDKPRSVAWYHMRQFFYLLPWLLKHMEN
jgi:polyprenyl-phospho-N-acetylgalactosaminyl synthase